MWLIVKKYKLKLKTFNTFSRIEVEEVYKDGLLISVTAKKDGKELKDKVLINKCLLKGTVFTKEYKNKYCINSKLSEIKERSFYGKEF